MLSQRKYGAKGYSIMELLIVIAIIGVLIGIVLPNITQVKSKSRDAQVRSDVQLLKLALVKAREVNTNNTYPSTSGWACIKNSGTCWNGADSASPTVVSSISPYLPGAIVPVPPGSKSGEFRYDSYVYNSSVVPTAGYAQGPYLIWPQESAIKTADCNGWNAGLLSDGLYYCYEALPR